MNLIIKGKFVTDELLTHLESEDIPHSTQSIHETVLEHLINEEDEQYELEVIQNTKQYFLRETPEDATLDQFIYGLNGEIRDTLNTFRFVKEEPTVLSMFFQDIKEGRLAPYTTNEEWKFYSDKDEILCATNQGKCASIRVKRNISLSVEVLGYLGLLP